MGGRTGGGESLGGGCGGWEDTWSNEVILEGAWSVTRARNLSS